MNDNSTRLLMPALSGVLFFASCTQIQLTDYVPAPAYPGKDAKITIVTGSSFGREIRSKVADRLAKQSYFTHLNTDLAESKDIDAVVKIDAYVSTQDHSRTVTEQYTDKDGKTQTREKTEEYYSALGHVSSETVSRRTGAELSKIYYSANDESCSEDSAISSVASSLAKAIVDDMIPKEKKRWVPISPPSGNPLVKQAVKQCEKGEWEQGRATAKQALAATPEEPEANFLMGLIEQHYGKFDEAAKFLKKAADLGAHPKYQAEFLDNARRKDEMRLYKEQTKRP